MKLIGECYKCIGMIDSLISRSASVLTTQQAPELLQNGNYPE